LLRLARFETEPVLARAAALALIGHTSNTHLDHSTTPDHDREATDRDTLEAVQIEKSLQQQDRISTQWLKQYAVDLRQGTLDVAAWNKVIQRNREQLSLEGAASDNESDVATSELLELIRLTAERALLAGHPNDALEIVIDNVDLIPARTQKLIETATWALDHSLYKAVIAMQHAHSEMYNKSPILLYSAAEAHTFGGQTEDAAGLAKIALAINPLPEQLDNEDKPDTPGDGGPLNNKPVPLHPQTIEDHAKAHVDIADELTERGLFHWAEQEYQLVIDRMPVDTAMSSSARLKLASMLGELQRHGDVVKTLEPLAQRINKDDEFRDRLIMRRFSYTVVQSNMDFHRGLLMIQQGDPEGAKPVLREAFDMYQENIDILIAMFQLDGDSQWKAEVAKTLDEQIRLARSEIEDARNSIQRVGPFQMSDVELAKRLNAYAWLVSNTAGDMHEALRFSQESLRLTPAEPALMDTCARCYFAVGDLEAAVKMQAEACRLMPHSPPLQRQLQEFRDALAK
jgi:tetratricopeptide (TPR) repeat protein